MGYKFKTFAISLLFGSIACADVATDQFKVATTHYRAKRWQLAATEFREFVVRFPQHSNAGSAVYYLGESLVQQKDFQQAAEAYSRFVKDHTNDARMPRALFRWGESKMLAGDASGAYQLLLQFHEKYPEHQLNEFALFYLGRLSDKGNASDGVDASIAWYSELLKSFPESPHCREAELAIAIQHYRAGRLGEAMTRFGSVETDYPDNSNGTSTDIRVRTRYWMGVTQMANNDHAHAAKTLLSVCQIDGHHPLATAATYFAAEAYRANQQLQKADLVYRMLTQRQPDEHQWADDSLCGRIRIAVAQSQHGTVDRLVKEFLTRYATSEITVDVLEQHARSLIARQEFAAGSKAISRAMETISHTPTHDQNRSQWNSLRFMAAVCHLGQGQWATALHEIDRIDLQPGDSLRARAALARGCARLELGNLKLAISDLEDAMSEFDETSMQDRCRAKLIQAHVEESNARLAEDIFEDFDGRSNEARWESAQRIAATLFEQGEYLRAIPYYKSLTENTSKEFSGTGHHGVAWCHYRLGRYQRAITEFETIVDSFRAHSCHADSQLMLAKSLEAAGDLDSAILAYRRIDQYKSWDAECDAAVSLSQILDSKGRRHDALIELEELVQRRTDHAPSAAVLYRLAWLYKKTGQISPAIRSFKRLVNRYPDSDYTANALLQTAQLQLAQFDDDASKATVIRLLDSTDQTESSIRPHALLLKAKLFARMKRWDEALNVLEDAELVYCHSEIAIDLEHWLAEAYFRTNQFDMANHLFKNLAASHRTSDNREWQALVPLRRAQLMAARSDWRAAAEQARHVRENYPEFAQAFEADYLLGRCMSMQARFREARSFYADVLKSPAARQTETAAMAQWMIGESYFHQKDFPEAIRAYMKVDILYSHRQWKAAALLQAAKCFELTNELQSANELYSRIVDDYSDTPFAEQAKQRRVETSRSASAKSLAKTE